MTPYEGLPAKSPAKFPVSGSRKAQILDPSRLAPEDAFYAQSPPRGRRAPSPLGLGLGVGGNGTPKAKGRAGEARRKRTKDRGRSSSRRRKGAWKKLLWVKQSYPDNYTDEYTFLDHLQRNPRLQPYEFWRLVADSTVIVQHVCSVIIFVCCFTGIFQERVSPVTVVGWSSSGTVLGWILWDFWVGQEERAQKMVEEAEASSIEGEDGSSASSATSASVPMREKDAVGIPYANGNAAASSGGPGISPGISLAVGHPTGAPTFASYSHLPPYGDQTSSLSPRTQQRIATIKSAILIYCALLGLSPILKSLTKSTTSDSIWAISAWLMGINVAFFDYGGGGGANSDVTRYRFPASLSTNAALMASTVLASRLSSTTHVFSLTLFSIEVFGLFPVFRRHLRHVSWRANTVLSFLLVVAAGGAIGVTVSGGRWTAAIVGSVLGSMLIVLAMGICSWWLIGLQKYKNEIHGPWDPARPIIRRRWD
ncbi:GPI2-domain-containing protein [Tothia fuscella]|uniref:GPI2-domain-containing protein n=1 Tax=Tothia fuscella TaxID=1048955 RepID=A0A9P4U426_9PEZI|nr:GPI2-domain-containing protein [Tothia fuscella]